MTEKLWIPFAAIGVLIAIEMGQSIARVGLRNYCYQWMGTLFWAAERIGIVKMPSKAEKPVRRQISKDIADL